MPTRRPGAAPRDLPRTPPSLSRAALRQMTDDDLDDLRRRTVALGDPHGECHPVYLTARADLAAIAEEQADRCRSDHRSDHRSGRRWPAR